MTFFQSPVTSSEIIVSFFSNGAHHWSGPSSSRVAVSSNCPSPASYHISIFCPCPSSLMWKTCQRGEASQGQKAGRDLDGEESGFLFRTGEESAIITSLAPASDVVVPTPLLWSASMTSWWFSQPLSPATAMMSMACPCQSTLFSYTYITSYKAVEKSHKSSL